MRRSEESEAFDRELALIGVLEELTTCALEVFSPERPLAPFLQRVAERFGSRVVLCLEQVRRGTPITLLASAGLSRGSRAQAWPMLLEPDTLVSAPLPYDEVDDPAVQRWLIPIVAGHAMARADPDAVHWWLLLIVDDPPQPASTYRRILERLSRTLAVALGQRHLIALLSERDAELRAFNQRLEVGVAERTHELQTRMQELREMQEQLVHMGKMAAVGTLVAGLSHELNNPIAIILGYVQTMLRHAPDEAGRLRALQAIERQAQRCGSLVHSLLDLSRPRPSRPEPTSMARLLTEVEELSRERLHQRAVQLVLAVDDQLPDVQGARQELESALLNLLFNAVDVSAIGGTIELGAHAQPQGGVPGVRVAVRDHGPGIAPDVLPHIFEPFFTTKPAGHGTGLGLSLTRQIIESFGGTLRVDTQPGRGTTMTMWLRAASGGQQS